MMDITCLLSALLFWTGSLLRLIFLGKEKGGDFSWYQYKQLDPSELQATWAFRIENKGHLIAASVLDSLAWFFFCFPILQMVYILNKQSMGSISRSLWLHSGIVVLTLGSCFTEWIATFMFIGANLACEMMFSDFNLDTWTNTSNDYIGLRSLEVAFFAIRGMQFWVDAFEWICMFFILVLIFVAVNRHNTAMIQSQAETSPFGALWNSVGLFIGLLCVLDFIADVLRTVNWTVFSQVVFWYGIANRLVFLPGWLLILGMRLPVALLQMDRSEQRKLEKIAAEIENDNNENFEDLQLELPSSELRVAPQI